MTSQIKHKEFIGVIKSGFVGALALTGIFIILAILSQGSPKANSLVKAIITVTTMPELSVIIGGIGFILGAILRRRFPAIQRGILPLVVASLTLALPLGFVVWIYHKAVMEVEYPAQELKLADCTNNVVGFHFNAPRGHDFQLQLRTPEMAASSVGHGASSYNVSGNLHISSGGSSLTNIPIGSDLSWPGGLTIVGLQNTNVLPLSRFIQPHNDYDFVITLDSKPPANASIWIEWWESKIDK